MRLSTADAQDAKKQRADAQDAKPKLLCVIERPLVRSMTRIV